MRRMLTDKLTKSIKEVVNAYNEGEFSAVEANPASTTETLTAIEINGVGYAVSGGSGSVEIDNKTIIENADGKLETAIGGYKEETSIEIGTYTLPAGSNDYDLSDSTLAHKLFDLLKVNTKYDVELTIAGATGPAYNIASAYIQSADKTQYRFGGYGALHIIDDQDNEYTYEFYVEDNNNIHIYGSSDFYPATGYEGSIAVAFGNKEVTIYHKIDSNYIEDTLSAGNGININSNNEIELKIENVVSPIYVDFNDKYARYSLRYDSKYLDLDRNVNNNLYPFLKAGWNNELLIDETQLTPITSGTFENWYKTNQSDLVNFVGSYIINYLKKNRSSDIYANNTFDESWIEGIAIGISAHVGSLPTTGVTVSVANDGKTITLTAHNNAGNNWITVDGIVYNYDTNEIATFGDVYFNSNLGSLIIDSDYHVISSSPFLQEPATWFNTPIQADKRLIPLVSDIPAVSSTAGTYVLKATVDAQGNVTYSWVAEV